MKWLFGGDRKPDLKNNSEVINIYQDKLKKVEIKKDDLQVEYNDDASGVEIKFKSPEGHQIRGAIAGAISTENQKFLQEFAELPWENVIRQQLQDELISLKETVEYYKKNYEPNSLKDFLKKEEWEMKLIFDFLKELREEYNVDINDKESILEILVSQSGNFPDLNPARIEWIIKALHIVNDVQKLSDTEQEVIIKKRIKTVEGLDGVFKSESEIWSKEYLLALCVLRDKMPNWDIEIGRLSGNDSSQYIEGEVKQNEQRIADLEAVLKNNQLKISLPELSTYGGGIRLRVSR